MEGFHRLLDFMEVFQQLLSIPARRRGKGGRFSRAVTGTHGNAADLDREEKLNERFPFVAKADDVCAGPDDSIGIRTHASRGSVDILHNLPPHTGDIKGPRWRHTAVTPGQCAACVCVQHPSNGSGSLCCLFVFFMWRKIKSEAERIYVFAASVTPTSHPTQPPPTLINNQIMGRRDE